MRCCFLRTVICVLDNKERVGYRAGISVDVLLVPPFASLTIAKFVCVSIVWFFFQLCTYTTFEYPVRIFFHMEEQHKPPELTANAQAVDTNLFFSAA